MEWITIQLVINLFDIFARRRWVEDSGGVLHTCITTSGKQPIVSCIVLELEEIRHNIICNALSCASNSINNSCILYRNTKSVLLVERIDVCTATLTHSVVRVEHLDVVFDIVSCRYVNLKRFL